MNFFKTHEEYKQQIYNELLKIVGRQDAIGVNYGTSWKK